MRFGESPTLRRKGTSESLHVSPLRRIHSQQMTHEEIIALMLPERLAHSVVCAWDDNKFKVFISLDEGIGNLHSRSGIDIIVQFPHYQHQRALQQMGILHVRALLVLLSYGVS